MSVEQIFMIIGFLLAAYAVVGNDAIQTLGTFLSSNSKRPWWVLWLFASSILVAVLFYGWATQNGDVSYGRLDKVPTPSYFHWWFIIPPLVLLTITRFGIPVSTTFLILSVFAVADKSPSFQELIASVFSTEALIGKMLLKSMLGYVVAFLAGIIIYIITSKFVEKYFIETHKAETKLNLWVVLQWLSTGFLWSQWLIQDMANIFVYLRSASGEPLSLAEVSFGAITFVVLIAFIFAYRGGAIQKIVTTKTNTVDIRSATIIDFIFGIIMFVFKELSDIPMSTTWVFIGLLAGREIAINYILKLQSMSAISRIVIRDLLKVFFGLLVSIALVFLIRQLGG